MQLKLAIADKDNVLIWHEPNHYTLICGYIEEPVPASYWFHAKQVNKGYRDYAQAYMSEPNRKWIIIAEHSINVNHKCGLLRQEPYQLLFNQLSTVDKDARRLQGIIKIKRTLIRKKTKRIPLDTSLSQQRIHAAASQSNVKRDFVLGCSLKSCDEDSNITCALNKSATSLDLQLHTNPQPKPFFWQMMDKINWLQLSTGFALGMLACAAHLLRSNHHTIKMNK
jgi:hypothetical protein